MTLCIAFRHFNRGDYDQNFILSDSRLTVVRRTQPDSTVSSEQITENVERAFPLLPENVEIVHQNDSGIKIHVIHYEKKSGRRDITITVAGAVALGILSAIHLEATLNGLYGKYSYEQVLDIIEDHLNRFWQTAYDQDIEYLIMLADDDGKTHLWKKVGGRGGIKPLSEVMDENGMLLGVIGDQAELVRQQIFGDVNKLTLLNHDLILEEALDIASVRALRAAIENKDNPLVGGGIQAAVMKGTEGYYMTASYNGRYFFRGVEFGPTLRQDNAPLKHPTWPYDLAYYDPAVSIETAAETYHK